MRDIRLNLSGPEERSIRQFEELRVLGALFEHDACIRSPDVSIGRTKINEVASA